MRRVKCPRCSAIVHARGDEVKCAACGLEGRVDAAPKADVPAKKDPLQITIDLRKLSPSNWGPGARAFTMFILLVGVFVAGSFTGMVLERNRDGPGGLASTADLFTGTSNDDAADTLPAEETGSGAKPLTVSSVAAGDSVLVDSTMDLSEPIQLDNKLIRLDIEAYGSGPFRLKLIPVDQEGSTARVGTAELGDYRAVRYKALDAPGLFRVEVSGAEEGWRVQFDQPAGETAPEGSTRWHGHGDAGKGPLMMEGAHTISFTPGADTVGSYAVWAYTEAGENLRCSIIGSANPDSQESDKVDCFVKERTRVYFDISAPVDKGVDDEWQLSIS